MANALKVLRKIFKWSVEQDILGVSPAFMVKLPAPKAERDRTLNAEEIKALWESMNDASISLAGKNAVKLALITAPPPGEVKLGVVKIYNQYRYDAQKQTALEKGENKLRVILAGDKVIDMVRSAKSARPLERQYSFIAP